MSLAFTDQSGQMAPFTAPSESGRTSPEPTREKDGNVQFQPDDLVPTKFQIEASPDLYVWIRLETGSLPATFTDFDATILPQRFYRP